MKRSRNGTPQHHRVVIDVGGTKITTTVSTIQRSSYLSGMIDLASWEDQPAHCEEIFLDRDPEIFAMLLRLMRQHPHVHGLLPSDPRLCASIIAEADFFGFDGLLNHIKAKTYYNLREAKQDYPELVLPAKPPNYPLGDTFQQWRDSCRPVKVAHRGLCVDIDRKFRERDEAHAVARFDEVYGSVAEALAFDVLPQHYLVVKNPLAPTKKIIQLTPVDGTSWFLVGDTYDSKYGMYDAVATDNPYPQMHRMRDVIQEPGFVRRIAAHALVEDEHGMRWVEPMVHVALGDQEEWMNSQPGVSAPIYILATLDNGDLANFTGGSARRTLLASDWFEKAVVQREGHDHIQREDYWTHVLIAEEPPAECEFSRARRPGAADDAEEEEEEL